jgi:hypothetical protein
MNFWKALVGFGLATSPFIIVACGDTASQVGSVDAPSSGEPCSLAGEKKSAEDGCNSCTCADGQWACTEMDCGSTGSSCDYEGVEYAHGESFQCDCNTCWCEDGQIGGTLIGCAECQPGETRAADDGCNGCSCADGAWLCTEMDCSPGASCVYEGVEYASGESWQCDCNSCSCTDGQISSTDIACAECQPGETKVAEDGCNTCDCANGQWACTDMACGSPGASCTYLGVEYADGESWQCDCNTCSCEDGLISTTLMACDCTSPADGGPCFAAMTRYYFDSEQGQCLPFTYGGCAGNGNNYETIEQCQQACSAL